MGRGGVGDGLRIVKVLTVAASSFSTPPSLECTHEYYISTLNSGSVIAVFESEEGSKAVLEGASRE